MVVANVASISSDAYLERRLRVTLRVPVEGFGSSSEAQYKSWGSVELGDRLKKIEMGIRLPS